MADIYSTENIGQTRAGDIKKTRNVTPTKKVTKKKARLTTRQRPSKKGRKGQPSENGKKDHIDVYA